MNATIAAEFHNSIEQYLGPRADSLLTFRNPTISGDRLHLPGPNIVEVVYAVSDRKPQVLVNLQLIFGHGRLANCGYVSILPGDQGVEHSAGASFPLNPDCFNPESVVKLAVEGDRNAVASTFGVQNLYGSYLHDNS
jgi:class I fructose-bisphosphate aldolase